jgi:hypothetical protein
MTPRVKLQILNDDNGSAYIYTTVCIVAEDWNKAPFFHLPSTDYVITALNDASP